MPWQDGRAPWGNGQWGNDMPWGNGGAPWGNSWGGNNMPWGGNNNNNNWGNNMPWSNNSWGNDRSNNPWGVAPSTWMDPSKPKASAENAWDDLLNAPHEMGRMPGGWKAPKISVPNPVEVADEVGKNAIKVPAEMNNMSN